MYLPEVNETCPVM